VQFYETRRGSNNISVGVDLSHLQSKHTKLINKCMLRAPPPPPKKEKT